MRSREEIIRAILILIGGMILFVFAVSPFVWMIIVSFMQDPYFIYRDNNIEVRNFQAEVYAEKVILTWEEPDDKHFKVEKEDIIDFFENRITTLEREIATLDEEINESDETDSEKIQKLKSQKAEKRKEIDKVKDILKKSNLNRDAFVDTLKSYDPELGDRFNASLKGVELNYTGLDNSDGKSPPVAEGKVFVEKGKGSYTFEVMPGIDYTITASSVDTNNKTSLGRVIKFRPEESYASNPKTVNQRGQVTLDNYYTVLFGRGSDFPGSFFNSVFIAGLVAIIVSVISSIAGYAVSRMRFPGRVAIPLFVLAMSMFPQISLIGYIYNLFANLKILDTHIALIMPYTAWTVPLALWINMSYFTQIPIDLDKAALVDGAGRLKIIFKVILPIALPGLFSSFLLVFISAFNEFLFALMLTNANAVTIPVEIAKFEGYMGQVPWAQLMAASAVSAVPLVIITLIFQKYVVAGLAGGAVKG